MRRRLYGWILANFRISQRRAFGLLGLDWRGAHHQSTRDPQDALRMRLRELAATRVRFGYRRLTVLLRREGWRVNKKRVYRLYQEEGLMVRTRIRRKKARGRTVVLPLATALNQRWSMDFVADRLENGRRFRILTVVDQFSRECVALRAKPSLQGADVVEVLERAIRDRGKPQSITVDNGSEFAGQAMEAWSERRKVQLAFIRLGRPMENGPIESFNGRLRDECLNTELFQSLDEVRGKLAAWRHDYNRNRPHSALGDLTPLEFATRNRRGPSSSRDGDPPGIGSVKGESALDPAEPQPFLLRREDEGPSDKEFLREGIL